MGCQVRGGKGKKAEIEYTKLWVWETWGSRLGTLDLGLGLGLGVGIVGDVGLALLEVGLQYNNFFFSVTLLLTKK